MLFTLYGRRRQQVRTHPEAKFERAKYSQSVATRAASRPFASAAIAFAAIAKPRHSESGTAPLSMSYDGKLQLDMERTGTINGQKPAARKSVFGL
jgi:hypothetical protein